MISVRQFSFVFLLLFSLQSAAYSDFKSDLPRLPGNLTCVGKDGKGLQYNNDEVMDWKTSTPDQYIDRSLVAGTVTKVLLTRKTHIHFAIDLDGNRTGDLEVIYNLSFGELPKIEIGSQVIACGDYITVGPKARQPSPLGAIIHWVHYNPGDRDGGRHPHGFVIINGKPFGHPTTK
jgi:hypothetical protein